MSLDQHLEVAVGSLVDWAENAVWYKEYLTSKAGSTLVLASYQAVYKSLTLLHGALVTISLNQLH